MKLLEKLKNTFFEEEYIEVEEPEKKEVVAKKVEPKEIKKEEKEPEIQVEEKKVENYSDSELLKKDSKVPYFEEEDFLEEEFNYSKKEEPKKIYGESADKLYSSIDFSTTSNKPYGAPLKEAFKPTPIISPIYGILDKNYRKEEVIDKKDKPSSYVSRKNADLDTVRRKAYGGLDFFEEIDNSENTISENNFEGSTEKDDNLLYDITSDTKPVVDQVTIADAEEYFEDLGLEYNIDYKDNRYEKATGRRTSMNNHDEIKTEKQEDSEEDANLEDNLFDIIDSMYEEGEE